MAVAAAALQPLPPLIPGVKLGTWRRDDPHAVDHDREYALARLSAMTRDRFTCRYCGFISIPERKAEPTTLKASGYLEAHHEDDDHSNNDKSNLVTTCPWCHMVHHIGFAGNQGLARMIYMPWMSQEDLNLLLNCLCVAASRGGELGDDAETLLAWLQALEGFVIQEYGEEMTDPASLGTILAGLAREHPDLYAQRAKGLAHLRVMPVPQMFEPAIAWWSEHTWIPGNKWSSSWLNILKQRKESYG